MPKSKELEVINDFQKWLQQVHDMSKQPLSSEEKRKKMSEYLDALSEETYVANFPKIVQIVQRSKQNCMPFKTTQEQVDNIISWLPRLADHKELLFMFIQQRRRNYHLADEEPFPQEASPEEIAAQNKPSQRGLALKPKGGFFKSYEWEDKSLQKKSRICDWGTVGLLVLLVVFLQFKATIPAWAVAIPLVFVVGLQVWGFRLRGQDRKLKQ